MPQSDLWQCSIHKPDRIRGGTGDVHPTRECRTTGTTQRYTHILDESLAAIRSQLSRRDAMERAMESPEFVRTPMRESELSTETITFQPYAEA